MHPVLIVRGGDPAAVAAHVEGLQVAASGRRRPDQASDASASAVTRFARVSGESSSRAPAAASSSERLMSSVSWARAPTRRASAETADCSACAAFSFARSDWTAARIPATSARTRSTAAPPSAIRSRRISRDCARGRSAAARLLGLGEVRAGRLEELPFGRGQVGVRPFLPLQGLGEPDAAVQLAGVGAPGCPRPRRWRRGGAGSVGLRCRPPASRGAAATRGPAPRVRSRRRRRRW